VRRVCAGCGIDVPVPESDRQRLHLPGDILTTRQGKGCEQCRNTGYRGRQCVSEILVLTEQLQAAIIRKESAGDIRELMRKLQIPTLRDSALEKVRAGIISLEEYTRAVMV